MKLNLKVLLWLPFACSLAGCTVEADHAGSVNSGETTVTIAVHGRENVPVTLHDGDTMHLEIINNATGPNGPVIHMEVINAAHEQTGQEIPTRTNTEAK